MNSYKEKIKNIIFGTDTFYGRLFDIVLIVSISLSILMVMLDSVFEYHKNYGNIFNYLEWCFTILFSVEYALRIYCVRRPASYIFSFFGIIDLVALVPTYLSLLIPGVGVFSVIRILRVLRIFRILKLVQYMGEADNLKKAILASRRKIFVFLFYVSTLVIIMGSSMYLIELNTDGFENIPKSIYWAIVTLTTVGYGDIVPTTNLGQMLAAIIMIMGYGIIAVPTGIVTSELKSIVDERRQNCVVCENDQQALDAKFCNQCGAKMDKKSRKATIHW